MVERFEPSGEEGGPSACVGDQAAFESPINRLMEDAHQEKALLPYTLHEMESGGLPHWVFIEDAETILNPWANGQYTMASKNGPLALTTFGPGSPFTALAMRADGLFSHSAVRIALRRPALGDDTGRWFERVTSTVISEKLVDYMDAGWLLSTAVRTLIGERVTVERAGGGVGISPHVQLRVGPLPDDSEPSDLSHIAREAIRAAGWRGGPVGVSFLH